MRKLAMLFLALTITGVAFAQGVEPPVTNGNGATLKNIVGTDKLVTVVLKESGALDQNLRIIDIGKDSFSVVTTKGERTAYLFSSVQEVRLQQDQVNAKEFNLEESRSLRAEEQKIVARAVERATEIFTAQNADQVFKMQAATLLAIENNKEAIDYLHRLVETNDVATQVDAALNLYMTGNLENSAAVVARGLQSGNRVVKAKAAMLAGLTKDSSSVAVLLTMLDDRAAEICAPAARALGLLGYRDAITSLMNMVMELNATKADAAVYALVKLGGDDVIAQVKDKMKEAVGQTQYRLALVLYKLDDPMGKKLMTQEMMKIPTIAPDAALVLARNGDWDSMQFLLKRLKARYDETPDKMIWRARAASSLIEGGERSAVSYIQELLCVDNPAVNIQICGLLSKMGKRRLIPVIQPLLESPNGGVVLSAATAVMSMGRPSFKDKLTLASE